MEATDAFTISRTFSATPERVFEAYTDPEQMVHWFAPMGFELEVTASELRPDGILHYVMRMANGFEMWGKFFYQQVEAPSRLELVTTFSDAAGGLTRHPASPTWPLETMNIITFEAIDGGTRFTLTAYPQNASEEEVRTFREGHAAIEQGFSGSLDQLAAYLGKG